MNEMIFDTEAGYFVSEEHRRIAEMVKDFQHSLELRFIPPKDRKEEEEKKWPFVLVDNPPGREPYLVMLLGEDEINASLIGRLFEMRVDPKDPTAKMKAQQAAQQAYRAKQQADEMEEMASFHTAMLKSPLHSYKHNGEVYT